MRRIKTLANKGTPRSLCLCRIDLTVNWIVVFKPYQPVFNVTGRQTLGFTVLIRSFVMGILHWIVKLIVKCITDCFIFWGVDLYYVWKYQISFILRLNVLLFVLEEQILNICSSISWRNGICMTLVYFVIINSWISFIA